MLVNNCIFITVKQLQCVCWNIKISQLETEKKKKVTCKYFHTCTKLKFSKILVYHNTLKLIHYYSFISSHGLLISEDIPITKLHTIICRAYTSKSYPSTRFKSYLNQWDLNFIWSVLISKSTEGISKTKNCLTSMHVFKIQGRNLCLTV